MSDKHSQYSDSGPIKTSNYNQLSANCLTKWQPLGHGPRRLGSSKSLVHRQISPNIKYLIKGFSRPSNISSISLQNLQGHCICILAFLVLKTYMENVVCRLYKKIYMCKKLGGKRVKYGRERICCLVQGLDVHFCRFDRISHY